MHPIRIDQLNAEQHAELDSANLTAKDGRLRIRAPIVLRWRREVTHCELFANLQALLAATNDFFDRYHRRPDGVRSIVGAHPA